MFATIDTMFAKISFGGEPQKKGVLVSRQDDWCGAQWKGWHTESKFQQYINTLKVIWWMHINLKLNTWISHVNFKYPRLSNPLDPSCICQVLDMRSGPSPETLVKGPWPQNAGPKGRTLTRWPGHLLYFIAALWVMKANTLGRNKLTFPEESWPKREINGSEKQLILSHFSLDLKASTNMIIGELSVATTVLNIKNK